MKLATNISACDGGHATSNEVRYLEFPGGRLLLCKKCWRRELSWRAMRNLELAKWAQYPMPDWENLGEAEAE
jgi:hypothetical protein